jgi:hypothetical protein
MALFFVYVNALTLFPRFSLFAIILDCSLPPKPVKEIGKARKMEETEAGEHCVDACMDIPRPPVAFQHAYEKD